MAVTTSSNSTLSADIVEAILVQPLSQRSTFLNIGGIPVFVSDGNPVHLPSLTSIGTATGFVAEGSAIGEASVATDEVVLLPSSVYAIKDIVKMTRESVQTSKMDLESAMSNAIVGRISQLVDNALWNGGTATTGSPVGLFQMTGYTNAGTAAGTALTAGHLIDIEKTYLEAYGEQDSAHWAVSPANWATIQKIEGDHMLQPDLTAGAKRTLLGYPVTVTKRVPDTAIALFDKNQIAIGQAPASVTILDQTFADEDKVGIRATARYDVKALNPAAIVKKFIT